MKRKANESFEDYKKRRNRDKLEAQLKLSGKRADGKYRLLEKIQQKYRLWKKAGLI